MKKLLLLLVILVASFALVACSEQEDNQDTSNILTFEHLNGHGDIVTRNAYILFEYEMRDYVKYQIAYVACTCRAPEVNYWKVAYVELSKIDYSIRKISFGEDGTGHYQAGFWGDSSPIPSGNNLELDDFETEFIPWLEGKTSSDLDGIEVFTNTTYAGGVQNEKTIAEQDLIDLFAGASVSTNNMIRVMKVLLSYHETHYKD